MTTTIQSAANSIPSASSDYYEKSVTDVNDVDEGFNNARDLGYLRYNTYRVSVAGELATNYDSSDMYSIAVQSRNKLTISFRNSEAGEKETVADLSEYDAYYKELLQQTDPEAYDKLIAEENAAARKSHLLSYTAPGIQVQVYMKDTRGNTVLVADSTAQQDVVVNSVGKILGYVNSTGSVAYDEDGNSIGTIGANGIVKNFDGKVIGSVKEGDELRKNFDAMLTGDYDAKKGTYYVKISRDDTVAEDASIYYVAQMSMGSYKYDYLTKEQSSEDTKNNTKTLLSTTSATGYNSSAYLLALQNDALANMLTDGYANMSDIYSDSDDRLKLLGESLFSCLL